MYWLGRYLDPVTLTYILRSSDFDMFCVNVRYLLNYKIYNHQILQSASSQCTDSADSLTWWPWPGDRDLYFGCSDIIYVNVPGLLKWKTSSHQTLHSASPRYTDLAGILTRWPWPIFCAPVPFTHFTLTFNISSTIRPTTIKPCIVLLNVRTPQVPWLGDLDLYFVLHWFLHLLRRPSMSSTVRLSTTKPYIVLLLDVLTLQVPPSGHMTFIQRRLNVDAMSGRCIDVEATLYLRHVPAGLDLVTLTYILHSSDFDTFYVDVWYLLKYKTYNH